MTKRKNRFKNKDRRFVVLRSVQIINAVTGFIDSVAEFDVSGISNYTDVVTNSGYKQILIKSATLKYVPAKQAITAYNFQAIAQVEEGLADPNYASMSTALMELTPDKFDVRYGPVTKGYTMSLELETKFDQYQDISSLTNTNLFKIYRAYDFDASLNGTNVGYQIIEFECILR